MRVMTCKGPGTLVPRKISIPRGLTEVLLDSPMTVTTHDGLVFEVSNPVMCCSECIQEIPYPGYMELFE